MAFPKKGSEGYVERVARMNASNTARQRETARINLPEIRKYRREGLVESNLIPITLIAEDELRAIIYALGGPDNVTEQERAIAEDFSRVGIVLRAELSRYVGGDRDAGKIVGQMASIRRQSLVALGLQRRAKELGLEDYIEAKAEKVVE